MAKVLDNRAVELDIAPGSKDAESLAAQAREAATKGQPTSHSEGVTDNAALALVETIAGGVKCLLDTTDDAIGTLAEDLDGIVQGVGDGVEATAQYTGGPVGSGVMGVGKMTGLTGKGEEEGAAMGTNAVESTEQNLENTANKGKEMGGSAVESTRETMGKTANKVGEVGQNVKETSQKGAEQTGLQGEK